MEKLYFVTAKFVVKGYNTSNYHVLASVTHKYNGSPDFQPFSYDFIIPRLSEEDARFLPFLHKEVCLFNKKETALAQAKGVFKDKLEEANPLFEVHELTYDSRVIFQGQGKCDFPPNHTEPTVAENGEFEGIHVPRETPAE